MPLFIIMSFFQRIYFEPLRWEPLVKVYGPKRFRVNVPVGDLIR